MADAAILQSLRARIREIEGLPPVTRPRDPSGLPGLDALIGGLPRPGIVEIVGQPGTGRTRVAAALVAERIRCRTEVAWVDGDGILHPPGLSVLGVALSHLLVVRPPPDGTEVVAWTAEQLLRSGCFSLVILSSSSGIGRWGGHNFARAAEHGRCTALVLSRTPSRDLPADVRVSVGDGRIAVLRDRSGRSGGEAALPGWTEEANPWA